MDNTYAEAAARVVDFGTGDATALLAREHAMLGMAAAIECYELLGVDHSLLRLIALPDFTYTRNPYRWGAGFPYGCIILLPADSPQFVPLEFRPNCCGVILSRIDGYDGNHEELFMKKNRVLASISGATPQDSFRSNHFLVILSDSEGAQYALFHGSFESIKKGCLGMPGLYTNMCDYWDSKIKHSPSFPRFKYLVGADAEEYFEVYRKYNEFTNANRTLLFDELFGEQHSVIFHASHEGFYDRHTLMLGGYVSQSQFSCPIMLSPEVSMPIVTTTKSIRQLTDEKVECELFVAPHGGGYTWPNVSTSRAKWPQDGFDVVHKGNGSVMQCDDLSLMPFQYRTNVASEWCDRWKAGKINNRLVPTIYSKG